MLSIAWLSPLNCEASTPEFGPSAELAALFRRDLTRLLQELRAFSNDADLWKGAPGITNSVGTLVLHLEGNLREFIGRVLGGVPYIRKRDLEFSTTGLSSADLIQRMENVAHVIPEVISALSDAQLAQDYPDQVLGGRNMSAQQFLIHLHGHLNYHLGQIDYLRRFLTSGQAVNFAGL